MGYVTRSVPVDHPDFGKAFLCECQQESIAHRRLAHLRAWSNLDIVADKTFKTFQTDGRHLPEKHLRDILRRCYGEAQNYAENPRGLYPWILFHGNYGSGKTHLAVAIANYRLEQGNPVLFLTVPDLLDHLRATFGPSSDVEYDDLFERVRNAPLLVLDDLGTESATPWAQEKLFQLINHRYLHKLPTVITTNVDLDQLDPRIRSRLLDRNLTTRVSMPLPDYRRAGETLIEQSVFDTLKLYSEMMFETFDFRRNALPEKERRNLQNAYEVAHEYADNPHDWLLLIGDHGSGKTHLAAAIANCRQALGQDVIMVTVPDLLDYLRAAFNPSSNVTFSRRFYEIRETPLLVLDDLDLTNASSWAREKIHQLTNHRYLARLPTVFTTTQAFEDLDPLLRSRLGDARRCKVIAILAPDYRGGYFPRQRSR